MPNLNLLVLLISLLAVNVLGFFPSSSKLSVVSHKAAVLKRLSMADGETDDEIRDRIRKKMRKNMFNENGVAYAPWVSNQIDEEAIIEDLFRKEKEGVKVKKGSILDRGEIETSEGMKWRMSNNLVDLVWSTSGEPNNEGFIVEKRPSYGGDFQEIASFREVAQLATKGAAGGKYRYTDPSTAGGSWIYRVRDCETNGSGTILCQCFVEVQTDSESKLQAGAAIGIVVIMAVFFVLGYALDPPK